MTHWTDFVDPDRPNGAYLPWKKVEARVGISRTTAWRLQKAGDFPKPYVVSPGRVAYRESEVEAWKASRGHRSAIPQASRSPSRPAPPPTPQEPSTWTPPVAEPRDLRASAPESLRGRRPLRPPGRSRQKPAQADQMSFDF